MNTRILSFAAFAMLMVVSTGCCNLKQFWFGRGARCGLCSSTSAPYLPPMVAPQAAPFVPYGPVAAPGQVPQQPLVMVAPQPKCGLFNHHGTTPMSVAPTYAVPQYQSQPVMSCCPPCGDPCGDPCSNFGSSMDSYQGDTCNCGMPHNDQIIGSEVIGGQVLNGQVYQNPVFSSGTSLQDDFNARGERIISQDPLPPGAVVVP